MKSNYNKLGNYIAESKLKNKDSSETNLVGLSNEKKFIKSKANIVGADLTKYKLISHNQFVYMPTTSRNGDKISVALFKENSGMISSSYTVFGVDSNLLNPDYLMLWFERPEFDRYARYHSHGSVREIFSWEDMKNTELFVPPLEQQNKVVGIKNIIENRISVLKKLNNNLLQLSKVIFKNWFVDFEPFGGVQPNDWRMSTLEEVCDLNAGGDKPKVVSDEITDSCIYPIYSNGLDNDGLYGYTNQAKIFEECVTVSARGTIGFVCLRHTPYVPIVRLVSVIPKKEFISAKYLYLFLDRLNIMGTGTTQQQLTIPDFKKTEILVPTFDIIESFTNYLNPLFEKIWVQEEEIKKLSKLRDTLLPKLMSGEIDVSKINCDLEV